MFALVRRLFAHANLTKSFCVDYRLRALWQISRLVGVWRITLRNVGWSGKKICLQLKPLAYVNNSISIHCVKLRLSAHFVFSMLFSS